MERLCAYLAAAAMAAVACQGGPGHAPDPVADLALEADPSTAETGGRVTVRLGGPGGVDVRQGSAVWEASGGAFASRGDEGCAWIAPEQIGTYEIRFSALDAGGRPLEAALSLEVRRFGQPPSPDCTIACANIDDGYAERDQIPVLDDPEILEAREADGVGADIPVLGIVRGGEARAYPITVLAYHEVINDELGGTRVTVSYSPLADFAAAFSDDRGGFGHTGMLYEGFHLLYDRASDSLWLPPAAECVKGKARGRKLTAVAALRTTWAAWKDMHPDTTVLWPDPAPPESYRYDRDPYDWYAMDHDFVPGRLTYHDLRLPRKTKVLGLWHGGAAMAFPLDGLGQRAVLNHEIGGRDFVIVADAGSGTCAAFRSLEGGQGLTFLSVADGAGEAFMKDAQTGTLWSITGEALEGPLAGRRLEPADAHQLYFFAWAAFRQGTQIWKNEEGILDSKKDKGGTP